MRKGFLLLFALVWAIMPFGSAASHADDIWSFFRPVPKPTPETQDQTIWRLRPIVTIPALKISPSTKIDVLADVSMLSSAGGGISMQSLSYDQTEGAWGSNVSFSLIGLLSGDLTSSNPVDFSGAVAVGFFNDIIMFGLGYDLGYVSGRSRFFGLVSLGVNFNNSAVAK